MGIALNQNIPDKKRPESQPWSVKRLFPLSGMVASITKTFVSPLDILLGYLILIIGLIEVRGKHTSWPMFLLTILILLFDVWERSGFPVKQKK